ncbi:MAG: hypothetical protein PWQ87_847 [Candidatus Woesearchaeota archaeon]|nr:hypothetical protein [Candidatus Woesearchaeota archaeon]
MTEYVLFKHPELKIRRENFGGIIKTARGLFLIDKKVYLLLNSIDNKKRYSELAKDKESKMIIDELLKLKVILKIKEKNAERIRDSNQKKAKSL